MDVEKLDDLRELIGEYWCLAFAEGQEGRNTDTPDGAAQKCISAIEAIIREARAALTPPEGSDQCLLELAATFETCIPFLPSAGQRNIGKAVAQLRHMAMGYVLVPVEPTSAMQDAVESMKLPHALLRTGVRLADFRERYAAMLAACSEVHP